jgi:hypothetical protein
MANPAKEHWKVVQWISGISVALLKLGWSLVILERDLLATWIQILLPIWIRECLCVYCWWLCCESDDNIVTSCCLIYYWSSKEEKLKTSYLEPELYFEFPHFCAALLRVVYL